VYHLSPRFTTGDEDSRESPARATLPRISCGERRRCLCRMPRCEVERRTANGERGWRIKGETGGGGRLFGWNRVLAGALLSRGDLILIYSRVPNKLVFAVVTSLSPFPRHCVYIYRTRWCVRRSDALIMLPSSLSFLSHPFHSGPSSISASFIFDFSVAHRQVYEGKERKRECVCMCVCLCICVCVAEVVRGSAFCSTRPISSFVLFPIVSEKRQLEKERAREGERKGEREARTTKRQSPCKNKVFS